MDESYKKYREEAKTLASEMHTGLEELSEEVHAELEQVNNALSANLDRVVSEGRDEPLVRRWLPLFDVVLMLSQEGDLAKTSQDYQDLVAETEARIGAMVVANPGVVDRYAQREQQVYIIGGN